MTNDENIVSSPNSSNAMLQAVPFSHIGLFEGIGGFSLAAKQMGWITKAWCEWNEFGQRVLRYHFPEAEGFGDITKTDFTKYANTIDILTGGFPCQPYSSAGKRLGKEDERHLFPEMLRAIREIQPCYVVGENVSGLTTWNGGLVFDEVQADLETEGYEVLPFLLPACAVNAPHRRDRIWFIAYSTSNRRKRERKGFEIEKGLQQRPGTAGKLEGGFEGLCSSGIIANTGGKQLQERTPFGNSENTTEERTGLDDRIKRQGNIGNAANTDAAGQWWNEWQSKSEGNLWDGFPTQSPLCSGDDGISRELDGITFSKWRNESLKAYGNAIVPAVALEIFKAVQGVSRHCL